MTSSTTTPTTPRGAVLLEWSVAALSLLGGAVIVLFGWQYGLTNVTGVGAGFFPAVAGIIMAVAGAMWLVQLAVARRSAPGQTDDDGHEIETFDDVADRFEADDEIDEDAEDAEFPDRAGWLRVGIIAAAVFGAAILLPIVGYTVSMTLMLAVVLFFVSKRPWWLALVVGITAAVASRLVFEGWLGTALPVSSIELIARLGL